MNEDIEYLLNKIRHFCAFQDRCISEVEGKLKAFKAGQKESEKIIGQMISEGFLDEERFARSFAGGKFRINHWGKVKIMHELGWRKVPEDIIWKGLEEIGDEEYEEALREILLKKDREIHEKDAFRRKQKLIAFGVQKGYEYGIVRQVIDTF